MRIAFIGAGTMAEAMVAGIIKKGVTTADRIITSDPVSDRLDYMVKTYGVGVTSSNSEAIHAADLIVFAVKPQNLDSVLAGLKGAIEKRQLVLSIVAGATIARIAGILQHDTVVRVMPNTPAQVGQGMSVWTSTPSVDAQQREATRSILQGLGKEIYFEDEKYIDMATAVSGSGPAYVFLIQEAFTDAAVHIGLSRKVAEELVNQTLIGSLVFAQQSEKHPAELRNLVTSPGGTTAEALRQFEHAGIRSAFTEAVIAAYDKAKQLGG
ncbi:MAG: pyrroline-5-carboxylate reductase [Dehalococcoidia bacterium]|nr:pyrroline-5-carboxylate reductase [Dehalococcoidia bacterium]